LAFGRGAGRWYCLAFGRAAGRWYCLAFGRGAGRWYCLASGRGAGRWYCLASGRGAGRWYCLAFGRAAGRWYCLPSAVGQGASGHGSGDAALAGRRSPAAQGVVVRLGLRPWGEEARSGSGRGRRASGHWVGWWCSGGGRGSSGRSPIGFGPSGCWTGGYERSEQPERLRPTGPNHPRPSRRRPPHHRRSRDPDRCPPSQPHKLHNSNQLPGRCRLHYPGHVDGCCGLHSPRRLDER
jgi:hypothetical protein